MLFLKPLDVYHRDLTYSLHKQQHSTPTSPRRNADQLRRQQSHLCHSTVHYTAEDLRRSSEAELCTV